MAVSKRLRYEILRRDGHTCRYCGAAAPDVKLAVDHVIPVALGGADEPSNLVTACEACNSGKTSTPADSPLVASVADDAFRWAAAMERAAETAHAEYETRVAYRDLFRAAWDIWGAGEGATRKPVPLDPNWAQSLDNFREAGLPDWELAEGVTAAMTNEKLKPESKFRYFCGICWTKIRKMQADARAIVSGSSAAEEPVNSDNSEQSRVSEMVLEAWKAKRAEAGREWTEEQASNILWQAASWWARGVGIPELLAAAERAAERLIPSIANYFGEGMDLLRAVELYYAATERLHHLVSREAELSREHTFAYAEMLLPTFETMSRVVHAMGELTTDVQQADVLRETAFVMAQPRDRLYDLFPAGYKWTWREENQVEWPPVLWWNWTPAEVEAPLPLSTWCGECDGPELHRRWKSDKWTWRGVERTILDRCERCHPAMLPDIPPWCGKCGGDNPAARTNPRFRTHNGFAAGQPCRDCRPGDASIPGVDMPPPELVP